MRALHQPIIAQMPAHIACDPISLRRAYERLLRVKPDFSGILGAVRCRSPSILEAKATKTVLMTTDAQRDPTSMVLFAARIVP